MHHPVVSSNQTVLAMVGDDTLSLSLPSADTRIGIRRLKWGRAEELGTPAYWCSQVWMWGLEQPDHYKLGKTLEEEVLACLLGGYGIPAEVGLAAYERLRKVAAEDPDALCDPVRTVDLLSSPLDVGARKVRYRFAQQKGKYVAAALSELRSVNHEAPDIELRDALTSLSGIGLKTASWVVRNWRRSDRVAILDIHIVRAAKMLHLFPNAWKVERNYREMEKAYLDFASAISAQPSLLDSVMWMTMRQLSPSILSSFVAPGYDRRSVRKPLEPFVLQLT
ncbi:hypothetical protein IP68_15315 [Blastomonas sp. AAP25]|uniref:8-oxoguanine DNA glycosylase n=1 Tax=Blastomonas sp. AAP25 TaxID=1523416 RepID=UPI0006B9D673|nr:hypothetical protein [Blastomonas sp. AAP25]KPF73895.1 hypothetical protein IP68_15315 [Blastomonas sp. AAP25]